MTHCQIPNLAEIIETHIGVERGRFVDVGAFDGIQWSNTHRLAKLGWTGIAIEPHPEFFTKLSHNLRELDVTCINLAIGDHNGVGEIYLAGSLSTIIDGQVEIYRGVSWSSYLFPDDIKKYPTQIRTLDHILEKHEWEPYFEFLSVDVEGAEIDVFRGFDVDRWRPKVIIVETHEESPERSLNWKAGVIGTMLDFYGYEKIQSDTINTIYVRR
jgi:FkbM family methyltransferase